MYNWSLELYINAIGSQILVESNKILILNTVPHITLRIMNK